MGRKTIVILFLAVVILLLCGYFAVYNQSNQVDHVKIGDAMFSLPEGFNLINSTGTGAKISNDDTNLTIYMYNDNKIDKYVSQYNESKQNESIPVNISNFVVGDTWVIKANAMDNPYVVHYWFVHNHKVYSIYTEDANKNTDSIVKKLIGSINN